MVSQHSLGKAIKQAREQADLTQDELSDRASLAYSTLAKIEQGAIKNPSVFTIHAIARSVGVAMEELLGAHIEDTPAGTKTKPIKFIYCDVNGVMVRFYHHAFVSLSEETGAPFERIESTFWHYNDPVNRGEMTVKDFEKSMAAHLGVPKIDWERHYMGSVQPVHEMHRFLQSVIGRYKVGLLTNTMPGFIDKMQIKKLLPALKFDAVVDSSRVGSVKPEEKIYRVAEEAAGVDGEEIFFIDDSRANLTAAAKLGWKVFWFDDYEPAESVRRIMEQLRL